MSDDDNVVPITKRPRKKTDATEKPEGGWVQSLSKIRGHVAPTLGNACIILSRAPAWKGVFYFNEFLQRIVLLKKPPDSPVAGTVGATEEKYWTDDASDAAIVWCERNFAVAFSRETMARAVRMASRVDTRHPVRKYLEALKWDGKKRLRSWLTDFFAVDASAYSSAIGTAWMISAVARAFEPGCKVDHVVIIEGGQRGGKSSGLRALCASEEWYLETGVELGSKDAFQVIAGKWIVELAELDSMSRSEASRVKAFVSAQIDTYRRSYGREVVDQPRGCVFAGTTNEDEYLKDDTGGGRYWPVWCAATIENRLNIDAIVAVRNQLWAEAVARYRKGEKWHLVDPTLIKAAQEAQEARRQRDPWEDELADALRDKRRQKDGTTIRELLPLLGVSSGAATKAETMRVARALKTLGWWIDARPVEFGTGRRSKLYRPRPTSGGPKRNKVGP